MRDLSKILSYFDKLDAPYFCEFSYLKKCFRVKIKKFHPDMGASEDEAKEIILSFKELEKLYKNERLLLYYRNLFERDRIPDSHEEVVIVNKSSRNNLFEDFYLGLGRSFGKRSLSFFGWLVVCVVLLFFVKDLVVFVLAVLVMFVTFYLYKLVL